MLKALCNGKGQVWIKGDLGLYEVQRCDCEECEEYRVGAEEHYLAMKQELEELKNIAKAN